jgi:hypothetical protein
MNRFLFGIVMSVFGYMGIPQLLAQTQDTIVISTFTFGSPQEGWFVFPSDTIRFEKILMEYTLKCNPAQNPPCGEWDYLTNTYLFDHTGFLDSSAIHQPMFLVNNQAIDTISYMYAPTYKYWPRWQYFVTRTDTASLGTGTVGSQAISVNHPFGSEKSTSRTRYLWRSSELISSGITAGNISGMRFKILNAGSMLRNLTVRVKPTSMDSLSIDSIADDGFITVYSKNTQFPSAGWNSLQFKTPANWDGLSNLIVEITFDNLQPGTDNTVEASVTGYLSALTNSGNDRVINTTPNGYVNIPINSSIAAIDTTITISFWAFGNPSQPLSGTCFEAVDSLGNRLLNSHTPWSDSQVFWDAGFIGTSYDRINKTATTDQIKGKWTFWAFTKNANTGSMKIYCNGALWHSGTGKTKPMAGIRTFLIGKGTWSGSQSYEGAMDEFAVFNTELDSNAIKSIFNRGVSSLGSYTSNLAAYYTFDDGNCFTVADSSAGGSHSPATIAAATNPLKPSDQLFKSRSMIGNLRPNVVFEQGVFTSQFDSVMVIDSIMNNPMVIVEFADSADLPGQVTDSLFVWPTAYANYTYNTQGQAVDSVFVPADATKILHYYTWYRIFPQVNRYELARYITPYGNNLTHFAAKMYKKAQKGVNLADFRYVKKICY